MLFNNLNLYNEDNHLDSLGNTKLLAGFGGASNTWGSGKNVRFGVKIVATSTEHGVVPTFNTIAEIKGVEGDFIYYTEGGLILSGAFSLLDTEITKSLIPTGDIVVGQELAFAPGFQANLSGRKEWTMEGGNTGFWQVQFKSVHSHVTSRQLNIH